MNREIIISVISGISGAILTIIASWFISYDQLTFAKKIEMIKLSRELTSEFMDDKNNYQKISSAIDDCALLFEGWGGTFAYQEINKYLLFFDNLGFYAKQGIVDYSIIDQIFGAYIIEAHQKMEIKRYIYEARKNNEQNQAFDDFEELAEKLEKIPERKKMVEMLQASPCFAFKGN